MARTYGEWLKEAREAKSWSQHQLAERAFMSRSMVAAIETGRRYPSESDAMALDSALGTGNVLTTFRPGRFAGSVADWFEKAREFERQATIIREFSLSYIPGLLQTEDYARAVIGSGYPRESEEKRHKHVVTRLERSQLFDNPVTPEVWVLLDEAAVHRPIGGREVMAAQLDHVAALADSERIRVHILPFSTAPHPLLAGALTLMWFEDQPPIAYTEAVRSGKIHDSPAMVTELQGAYDLALGEALPLQQSVAHLRAQAEEFRKHGSQAH